MKAETIAKELGNYAEWQLLLDTKNRTRLVLDRKAKEQRLTQLHRISRTAHGQVLFTQFVGAVTQSINEVGSAAIKSRAGRHYAAIFWLSQMESPGQIAALALKVVIDSIGREISVNQLADRIGGICETETRAGRLKTVSEPLFAVMKRRLYAETITYALRSETLARLGVAKADWGPQARGIVGCFLLDRVIESTGLVKTVWHTEFAGRKTQYVQPVNEVLEFLQQIPPAITNEGSRSPIRVIPPEPWCSDNIQNYWPGSTHGGLVGLPRYASTQREELHLAWTSMAGLAKVMAAANYLQSQPFILTKPMAVLLEQLWNSDRKDIDRLFPCPRNPEPIPPLLEPGADEALWKIRNRAAALAYNDHRQGNPHRVAIARLVHHAKEFAGHPIYFPVHTCYRGRLFVGSDFSYQGGQIPRASTQFHPSISEPLTDDGFQWCLRAAASAYIGRRTTFDERLHWATDNLQRIQRVAADPYDATDLWTDASNPWQFVAASQAIASYLQDPSTPIGLPIHFDQTCSGLGHIACLVRDHDSAERTRIIIGSNNSLDLYEQVAAALTHRAQIDIHEPGLNKKGEVNEWKRKMAIFWLQRGIKRRYIKEAVMASPYGIKAWGIRLTIVDQLMADGKHQAPTDLLEFVDGPASYLSQNLREEMKPYMAWSDAVARWLRAIASKVGGSNQPLQFTTPTGFVIRDAELTTTAEKYATILNGQRSFFTHIAPDETSVINTRIIGTRIVANYIHGMDAALCANVIARCEALAIPIATVHDCFSTTPNNAALLHQTLLEEIKALHQTSWLPIFRDEVQQRTGLKLPPPPLSKTLDTGAIGTCPGLFS